MQKLLFLFLFIFSMNVKAQNWNFNYEKSLELASQESKNIILVFSGSDWCGPCIKLDNEIFQSVDFINYANKNWVLLKADFPKKKNNKLSKEQQNHNDMLAEKYKATFPLIVVLDSKGNVLGKSGYKKYSPKEFIEHLVNFE